VDRCALFVDAGYVLSDGAMAVHGTRRRDSVSWDYAGLLKLLAGLARDSTGLPVLRCYWYEATVDSRRTSEHEALAELPGLKLRLGKKRPGRREGVETDIHRDLTTLARNHAVSDAVIVSAEEDLAQVVAEVQDLGVRVTIVHITVDGNWTISRALRQEPDDIAEISSAHLRPFVDLIPGAEPARADEYAGSPYQAQGLANGRSQPSGAMTHQGLPAAALPAPAPAPAAAPAARPAQAPAASPAAAAMYNAPVQADYPRAAEPLAAAAPEPQAGQRTPQAEVGRAQPGGVQRADPPGYAQGMPASGAQGMPASSAPASPPAAAAQPRHDDASLVNGQQAYPPEQSHGATAGASPGGPPQNGPPPSGLPQRGLAQNGLPQPSQLQSGLPQSGLPQSGLPQNGLPQSGLPQNGYPPAGPPPGSLSQGSLPQNGLPQSGLPQNGLPQNGLPPAGLLQNGLPPGGPPQGSLPQNGQAGTAGVRPAGPHGQPAGGGAPQYPPGPGAPYGTGEPPGAHRGYPGVEQPPRAAPGPAGYGVPAQGQYLGQQPPAAPQPPMPPVNVSLADAVQAAHVEGFSFGEAVARDAPALWLEAVLARKPRMPSDLEARLLQGSALPIDSLLHDEVRHALRRGFWDALERSRR
jgi:hypothetical protein